MSLNAAVVGQKRLQPSLRQLAMDQGLSNPLLTSTLNTTLAPAFLYEDNDSPSYNEECLEDSDSSSNYSDDDSADFEKSELEGRDKSEIIAKPYRHDVPVASIVDSRAKGLRNSIVESLMWTINDNHRVVEARIEALITEKENLNAKLTQYEEDLEVVALFNERHASKWQAVREKKPRDSRKLALLRTTKLQLLGLEDRMEPVIELTLSSYSKIKDKIAELELIAEIEQAKGTHIGRIVDGAWN